MRVAWPPASLPAPVVSYTTFSPLPDPPHAAAVGISSGNLRQIRRSVSVALSAGCPARVLPGIVLCEARTFLRWRATCGRSAHPWPNLSYMAASGTSTHPISKGFRYETGCQGKVRLRRRLARRKPL